VEFAKRVSQRLLSQRLTRSLIPIPASKNPDRIQANADIFDFELTAEDMKALDDLEIGDAAAASVNALKEVRGP
jgi:diketogulonate reductase-like aldo/keto reductase